jgi:hypothetical protein
MNQAVLLGLLRHALTFGGGLVVSYGVIDAGVVESGVGAVITLAGILLSVFAPEKKPQ